MPKNQYRLKDKRASIFKRIEYRNERGTVLYNLKPLTATALWCWTQNLSGNITDNALVVHNEEQRLFVFNYVAGIEQGDRIFYKGKWYEITRFNSTADYNDEIFVYVKDTLTPKPDSILP